MLAVELSSFQLHWSSTVRPLAGAVLNLAPDHLDWHGSMADYAAAKARIWHADVAIGNADDPAVVDAARRSAAPGGASGRVHPRPSRRPGSSASSTASWSIAPSRDRRRAARRPPRSARAGAHNVANALAASALARAYGVDAEAIAAGLRAFVPDPHRNQFVATVGGVDYVDDSKATNPHAARASLLAYPRIVWIAGGQLKGAPVDELVAEVAPRLVGGRPAGRRP